MLIHKFDSTNVRSVIFDETRNLIEVLFVNGKRYRYSNVTYRLVDEWANAISAGSWFVRVIKGNPHRYPGEVVDDNAPTLDTEIVMAMVAPPVEEPRLSSPTVEAADLKSAQCQFESDESHCTHVTLRNLNEGVCPICTGNPDGNGSGDLPSDPDPTPTPAAPPRSATPVPTKGNALTSLTREEAISLLGKLKARRMRDSLRDFIRGSWDPIGEKWVGGAWDVVEPGVSLDWNFHHDALVMHVQAMLEEWVLAGLNQPHEVGTQIQNWIAGRPEGSLERDLAESYLEHWKSTGEEQYVQRAQDLAINVGPISLKSRIVMVLAPAWMWLRSPSWEVFCASGTPSNVSRDSLACRDLVISSWYKETFGIDWTIRSDLDRIDKWGLSSGGSRESRGAGSAITGVHADCILIDDPDSSTDVWSEAARRDTMIFWLGVGNRIKDPRRPLRLIVQQNLHEEDLTSRIIRNGVPRLAIPVEFSPINRDNLYTAPFGWKDPRIVEGELIHPKRFTPEVIVAERRRLGTHGFEAQYNCNPRPLDGGMIKRSWFQFFKIDDEDLGNYPRPVGCSTNPVAILKTKRPIHHINELAWLHEERLRTLDIDEMALSVDATFGSLKESASAVGLLVAGRKDLRRYIFEDASEPLSFHGTIAAIKRLIAKWPIRRVLIELKANGASIIEELEKQIKGGDVLGLNGKPAVVVIEPVNPEGGKESRAAAMIPAIEAGMVYLLDGCSWLEAFVGEVSVFPNAKRDDRVDALSQVMTRYRDSSNINKWRQLAKR